VASAATELFVFTATASSVNLRDLRVSVVNSSYHRAQSQHLPVFVTSVVYAVVGVRI
jgi:hypothetical protein